MPEIKVNVTITVLLTNAEFRIIGLALSGKIRSKTDHAEARGLSLRLMEQRHHQIKEMLGVFEGAMDKAREEIADETSDHG